MSQTWPSGHDRSLIDGHGVFGVIRYDGVAWFMIRRDQLVLFVYFCTPPLGALRKRKKVDFMKKKKTKTKKKYSDIFNFASAFYSPMSSLSLANSSSFIVTMSLPSTAAFRAAWLTRFSRSAPEKPTVPRAMILASIAAQIKIQAALHRLRSPRRRHLSTTTNKYSKALILPDLDPLRSCPGTSWWSLCVLLHLV